MVEGCEGTAEGAQEGRVSAAARGAAGGGGLGGSGVQRACDRWPECVPDTSIVPSTTPRNGPLDLWIARRARLPGVSSFSCCSSDPRHLPL